MNKNELNIIIAIPFMFIILPIHYLSSAIDYIGYLLFILFELITGQRLESYAEYREGWVW